MDEKDKIIAELRQQIDILLKRIQQLEEEVARLKMNSHNSSKPPSSDIVKPKKTVVKVGRRKRKRGGQHGHRKFSRTPFGPEQ
ncbi:MAG TPA: IS66 family transposase, partial [Phycisphaerales bacterium]|nr:IS66 family transposase [Phycisphaerales bacterium]